MSNTQNILNTIPKKEGQGECWFWHDWTAWKTIEEGKLLRGEKQQHYGFYILQQRSCKACNKVDRHTIRTEVV